MKKCEKIQSEAVAAFYYFNPYALLDGDRANTWSQLREDYRRALERNYENTRNGFLRWLIHEANESRYCREHDC